MDARETVLLAEDDAALSTLVSGLLEDAGYQPVTIADHALIPAAVEQWRPRCVLLGSSLSDTRDGCGWSQARSW